MLIVASLVLSLSAPPNSELAGTWTCGPYELNGQSYNSIITETMDFRGDGSFSSVGVSKQRLSESEFIESELESVGDWKLENGFLLRRVRSTKVTRTSAEWISVDKIQARLDATAKPDEWRTYQYSLSGKELKTKRIAPGTPEIEVEVSCVKA